MSPRHPVRSGAVRTVRTVRAALAAAVAIAALAPVARADDTEIFFGRSSEAFENNPNVLFLLDTSGSMDWTDPPPAVGRRMDRLKLAMADLLDQSSNFNVGLAAFSGHLGGGSIHYPVGHLEGTSRELCEGGDCGDELVVARSRDWYDDGVQDDDTDRVNLWQETLVMSDAGTREPEVAGPTVTRTAIAASGGWEARDEEDEFRIGGVDGAVSDLFFRYKDFGGTLEAYRFEGIDIPPDATVTAASIAFVPTRRADQKGSVSARVLAERTVDPAPYPRPGDGAPGLADRVAEDARIGRTVRWEDVPAEAGADGRVSTEDLAGMLGELVRQSGWRAGGAVSFVLAPTEEYVASEDDLRRFHGAGAIDPDLRPVLSYTVATGVDDGVERVERRASAHVDEYVEPSSAVAYSNPAAAVSTLFHTGEGRAPRRLALRFDGIAVPADAVVEDARLTLHSADRGAPEAPAEDWTRDPAVPAPAPEDPDGPAPDGPAPDKPASEPELAAARSDPEIAPFAMTVQAELDDDPAPYAAAPLGARAYTPDFETWNDVDPGPNESLESPNLAGIVQQVIDLDGWRSGDDLSLVIAPPSDYADIGTNVRRFLTSRGAVRPKLEIVWRRPDDGGVELEGTQTVAIRFADVHVPPAATIKSAEVVFTAAATDDAPTSLEIAAEAAKASERLRWTANDVGRRPLTGARETWTPEPWDALGAEYATPDLSRVVQEVVDTSGWCGGNPLTVLLSGEGRREAHAFSGDGARAPKLRITYEPSSVTSEAYCSNASVDVAVAGSADDAVQGLVTGAMRTDGNRLATDAAGDGTGERQSIGLRFRGVRVPQGANVVSAAIRLTSADDITDTRDFELRVERTGDARAFLAGPWSLGARDWSADAVPWRSVGPVAAGEPTVTADVGPLVQAVVSRGDWAFDQSIAFRLDATGTSPPRRFLSIDGDPAFAPSLVVYYESERTEPGTRFRDNLKAQVDALPAQGGTPIVGALYESARYFRGESVEFGRTRGVANPNPQYGNRRDRVSHPFAYEGGTVVRPPGCNEADLDAEACTGERIDGSPVYVSPMASQCQSNHIVLLSDGIPNGEEARARVESMIDGGCRRLGTEDGVDRSGESCGRELAGWLAATDHAPGVEGVQNVTLHTVALALGDGANPELGFAREFLRDLADGGGGGFYEATSSAELVGAFKTIFDNVSRTDASFVTPTVTVSSTNRMRHREDVYYTLFRPATTARWDGNLKRYRLRAGTDVPVEIVDRDGEVAIDADAGTFKDAARSFWSRAADGGAVTAGGAAERLGEGPSGASNALRRVVTYTGGDTRLLAGDTHEIAPSNPNIDPDWLDLPGNATAAYRERLLRWARGQDVLDVDGDDDTTETRAQMGDPMHSQPVLLTWEDGTDEGRSLVFAATNEGFLHAIESETGDEAWAFMPKELMKNLHRLHDNRPSPRLRPYGLDGGITPWIHDVDGDGRIDPADGDRATLYLGMRRGGNRYYALDVTDPANPRYLWQIEGGRETVEDDDPTTASGDWRRLGDTWSRPVVTRVLDGETVRDAIVFGGGYDENQDAPAIVSEDGATPASAPADARRPDSIGHAIFVADARTGEQLWRSTALDFPKMLYSIPSELRVIDIDFDGLADRIFVGDMGGQVWRLDFDASAGSASLDRRITGGVIAELAGDDPGEARRFYHPPDVALISVGGEQRLSISIGSGWRAHPLDTGTQERFYNLRSSYVYGPPVDAFGEIAYPTVYDDSATVGESTGFANVTKEPAPTPADVARGWYIDLGRDGTGLARPGEKALATSLTVDNKVVFTTYMPENDVGACAAAVGSSAVYAVNVLNGAPVFRSDADAAPTVADRREELDQPGLAPPVSVIFPEDGRPTTLVGAEPLDGIEVPDRRRTFWQEMLEEELPAGPPAGAPVGGGGAPVGGGGAPVGG